MNLLRTFQLLFARDAFLEAEIEHIRRKKEAGEAYGDIEEFRPEAAARIGKKRRGFAYSFAHVFLLLVAGALSGEFLNSVYPLPLYGIRVLRAVSVLLIAWSVLSRLGYETPTMKGETLLELTNLHTFKFFYCLGLYLAGVSLFLDPT